MRIKGSCTIASAICFSAMSLVSCRQTTEPDSRTPIANAGPDQAAKVGQYVILDGSGSTRGNGDTLKYTWTADANNPAQVLFLPFFLSIRLGFVKEGVYKYQLVVNNGINDSKPDGVTVTVTSRNQVIFSDPVMELQVRYALKNPTGELATQGLTRIDTLVSDIGFGKVTSLDGITNCTNLKFLIFGINQIVDLSPLATMTQLEELDLDQNYSIVDVSPLGSLVNLKKLNLESNNILDITPLRNMAGMVNLNLINNPVTDISSLYNMTELNQLWIESPAKRTYVPLAGTSVIAKFTKLWLLWISGFDCRDLSFVSTLSSLQYLRLSFCNVKDIASFANLTQLQRLYMDSDSISDITPLSNLANLNILDLSFNQICNIKPLVDNNGLGQGDAVGLSGNPLDSISVNQYIPQLKSRGVIVFY